MKMQITDYEKNIAKKLLELMNSKGFSTIDIGKKCNISHQQVDKYCKGINRISAARLRQIAAILNVNIMYFYDDDVKAPTISDSERSTREMARVYRELDEQPRRMLLSLARSIKQQNQLH